MQISLFIDCYHKKSKWCREKRVAGWWATACWWSLVEWVVGSGSPSHHWSWCCWLCEVKHDGQVFGSSRLARWVMVMQWWAVQRCYTEFCMKILKFEIRVVVNALQLSESADFLGQRQKMKKWRCDTGLGTANLARSVFKLSWVSLKDSCISL
jgi:hypothetical protein